MKRKQMKKITALLTAAVLSLGILAGCGTQNAEREPAKEEPTKEEAVAEKAETIKASGEETVKITFWSHFGGDDGKYLNNMVAEYQALHPEVEIEHLEVTNEDYYTKFTTGILRIRRDIFHQSCRLELHQPVGVSRGNIRPFS